MILLGIKYVHFGDILLRNTGLNFNKVVSDLMMKRKDLILSPSMTWSIAEYFQRPFQPLVCPGFGFGVILLTIAICLLLLKYLKKSSMSVLFTYIVLNLINMVVNQGNISEQEHTCRSAVVTWLPVYEHNPDQKILQNSNNNLSLWAPNLPNCRISEYTHQYQ